MIWRQSLIILFQKFRHILVGRLTTIPLLIIY
ncbi:unnamed protein product [Oppiella nova]|uniref:Uncharacterized protein n=1 Tax=Oppiella nova TaxID=334625 RepID=A0A7R9MNL4_9ACAR|nr:unnamed protein product [Oppiella nova]CAG2180360.1 unnamed protein product [Oppiella nova]